MSPFEPGSAKRGRENVRAKCGFERLRSELKDLLRDCGLRPTGPSSILGRFSRPGIPSTRLQKRQSSPIFRFTNVAALFSKCVRSPGAWLGEVTLCPPKKKEGLARLLYDRCRRGCSETAKHPVGRADCRKRTALSVLAFRGHSRRKLLRECWNSELSVNRVVRFAEWIDSLSGDRLDERRTRCVGESSNLGF
jgi:hypothetical protein